MSRPDMPLVAVSCDRRSFGAHAFHMAGEKYVTAVRDGAQALPLLLPVLDPPIDLERLVARVDGFLFTGAPSNVSPRRYGGTEPREGVLLDEFRDTTTLELLRLAIKADKPVLCICRGMQELNVALGGTLHQHVQEIPGRLDHRADRSRASGEQYDVAHPVSLTPHGLLARLTGKSAFEVNSLHGQGIDCLADGLQIEAVAPDGQIEAVSLPSAGGFVLGIQWHPEWYWAADPVSAAIFGAFGQALGRARHTS